MPMKIETVTASITPQIVQALQVLKAQLVQQALQVQQAQ